MIDLRKFKRPALHFSGGKDSLACLHLYKPQLELLTVYHVNTGDQCPEIAEVVEGVKAWVPNFVELKTNSREWRKYNGMPSDLVPASSHLLGRAYGMSDLKLSGRFDCCFANLMEPMHRRMISDGVDCVIRGTKESDFGKVPMMGQTDFYYIDLPIYDWTHEEVFAYLESQGVAWNPIYDHAKTSAPECLTCTAWWDDGKAAFLRANHPLQYIEYTTNLSLVRDALRKHLADLESELA